MRAINSPMIITGMPSSPSMGRGNRAKRTGYKVVRVPLDHGRPKGIYQDFLTGFVTPEGNVWGRPVGVTVMKDGSLLVSEDANSSIWRITYNK